MSTPTTPSSFTCSSRPAPADASELEKLQYCREAVDCSLAIANYNQAIKEYNDIIQLQNEATEKTWQNKFDADLAAKKKELEDERRDTKCVLWTDFTWLGRQNEYCRNDFSGFEADTSISEAGVSGAINGGCTLGQGKARCKRTVSNINDELSKFRTSYQSKPVPKSLLEQNNTTININCCLNFMNIVGTASGNEQSCLATIDQLSEKLKEVDTVQVTESTVLVEPTQPGETKTTTEIKGADVKTQEDTDVQKDTSQSLSGDTQKDAKKDTSQALPYWLIYVIIVAIVILFILGLLFFKPSP